MWCETNKRAVLVVAHPGHELLLHGWLQQARPRIFILTDGSGREGTARIDASEAYTNENGASHGSIFGRLSDMQFYQRILDQDFDFFHSLADEICHTLLTDEADYVVGDSAEGYNSVHDVCRLLINCAVSRAQLISRREIPNFDYPVVNGLKNGLAEIRPGEIRQSLDQATFHGKLAAAQSYFPQLINEVRQALVGTRDTTYNEFLEFAGGKQASHSSGLELFRTECLRPADCTQDYRGLVPSYPYYEVRGAQRVADGFYNESISRDKHVLPIAVSLRKYAAAVSSVLIS